VLRTIAGPNIDTSPFPGLTTSRDRFDGAMDWDMRVWLGKPQEFTFNIIASGIFFVTELSSTVYENSTASTSSTDTNEISPPDTLDSRCKFLAAQTITRMERIDRDNAAKLQ
jgi:hypothetical protein